MYKLLAIASHHELAGNAEPEALGSQIEYLRTLGICVDLLFDPDDIGIERAVTQNGYDAVYTTTMFSYEINRDGESRPKPFNIHRLLMHLNQPVIGSDLFVQMLVNDKTLCAQRTGIYPEGYLVTRTMFNKGEMNLIFDLIPAQIYPVIVKPNTLSCSLGLSAESVVYKAGNIRKIVASLFGRFAALNEVRIEHYIEKGNEYTVSVLGNGDAVCHSVTSIRTSHSQALFNDESQKKLSPVYRRLRYSLLADTSRRSELLFHTRQVADVLGLKDFARLDFMYDSRAYLIDVNALPVLGNAFSWEWQQRMDLEAHQLVLLPLAAFHYRQLSSGFPDPLPTRILDLIPPEIHNTLMATPAVDKVPESTPPNGFCGITTLYSMPDRVTAEIEVLDFLCALTNLLKPKLVVETGTYHGATAMSIAKALARTRSGRLVTIEKDSELCERARKKLGDLPVEVVCSDSLRYVPDSSIDLLFLDSHRPYRAKEFAHFRPYLSPSAVIVWHDSSPEHHEVYQEIERLFDSQVLDRLSLPTPRGLTISMIHNWTKAIGL